MKTVLKIVAIVCAVISFLSFVGWIAITCRETIEQAKELKDRAVDKLCAILKS